MTHVSACVASSPRLGKCRRHTGISGTASRIPPPPGRYRAGRVGTGGGAARRGGVGGAGGGETEQWQNFCPFTVDTLLIGSTLRGLVPRARPLRGNTGGRAFRSSPQIFCRSSTGYEPYVPFARGQLNNWRRPIFPTLPPLPSSLSSLNHRLDGLGEGGEKEEEEEKEGKDRWLKIGKRRPA